MKEKITLAIYDESQLQKELLHHQFERLRFDVLYSTMHYDELCEYFEQRPADVLLVNWQNRLSKFTTGLKKFRKRSGRLSVIFYNTSADESVFSSLDKISGIDFYFVSAGWANLFRKTVELSEPQTTSGSREVNFPAHLTYDNSFVKISSNKKYIDILRYLKEGKSNRQIAYLTHSSVDSIKYCIKKMHDETGSNTTKMVADAVKAGLI